LKKETGMPEFASVRNFAATLRQSIILMNCYAGSGHPGGALSCADIIAWLFDREKMCTKAVHT
jgi:transketolase